MTFTPEKDIYNFFGLLEAEMTATPDSSLHFMMVPFDGKGNAPIVPKTGVGSLSPTISTVIQSFVPGMIILPR